MRQITKTVYTAAELKEHAPAAFEHALKKYREFIGVDDAAFLGDEILGAIKGAFDAAGVILKDYSLSAYGPSDITARWPSTDSGEDIGEMRGPRAVAWLENNLLGPLRVPHISLKDARAALAERTAYYKRREEAAGAATAAFTGTRESARHAAGRYAADALPDPRPHLKKRISRLYNKPGEIPDCPFTGMCYDDAVIAQLVKDVRGGDTLREAFEGLAYLYRNTLEKELEYRGEEAQFLETSDANGWEYTEEGEMV